MKKDREHHLYWFEATITGHCRVLVAARSPEEAKQKVERGDYEDAYDEEWEPVADLSSCEEVDEND